ERGRVRLRSRLERRGIALSAGLLAVSDAAAGPAVPPAWIESAASFAGPGRVPRAISALANGVTPMFPTVGLCASTLAAGLLIAVGGLIAASTATDPIAPPAKKEAASEPLAKEAPKPPAGERLVVTGKVTDANRKAVAGAKLFVPI